MLQARAIENQAFAVGVNRAGTDPQFVFDGRSCAFDPHGACIWEADAQEQILSTEIDPEICRAWRREFSSLGDAGRF